jgi:thioesterase domain-containing protein
MAQALRQAGHEIALVAILDTSAPKAEADPVNGGWDDTAWLCELIERMEKTLDVELHLTEKMLAPLTLEEQLLYVNQCLQQQTLGQWAADSDYLRGLFQVFKANSQARYTPSSTLRVPIALLRTLATDEERTAPDCEQTDPTWGWAEFADGPVDLYEIPGDHLTMIKSPHVQSLAMHLAIALGRVDIAQTVAGSVGL